MRKARANDASTMPVSLDHVHLFCSDLATTERFFVEMLGAERVWDEEAAGARNVRLRLGRAFVQLYDQPPRRERGGAFHHLGVHTDDLDGLLARMRERGHVFRHPVREEPRFRYVMVAGPDDLLIELFEAREPARWQIPG
jgi:catechol 2,3-dioxygenase-like lactoylglutathione lyase family enzyme